MFDCCSRHSHRCRPFLLYTASFMQAFIRPSCAFTFVTVSLKHPCRSCTYALACHRLKRQSHAFTTASRLPTALITLNLLSFYFMHFSQLYFFLLFVSSYSLLRTPCCPVLLCTFCASNHPFFLTFCSALYSLSTSLLSLCIFHYSSGFFSVHAHPAS